MAYYLVTTSSVPRYYIVTTSLLHRSIWLRGSFMVVLAESLQLDAGITCHRHAVCSVAPRTCLCLSKPPNGEWSVDPADTPHDLASLSWSWRCTSRPCSSFFTAQRNSAFPPLLLSPRPNLRPRCLTAAHDHHKAPLGSPSPLPLAPAAASVAPSPAMPGSKARKTPAHDVRGPGDKAHASSCNQRKTPAT